MLTIILVCLLMVFLSAYFYVRLRSSVKSYKGVNPHIVEFLITELNRFPLHQAVFKNDFSAVKKLLKEGYTLADETDDGQTPLHVAAECGLDEMCIFLIESGVEIDALDNFGGTALHAAAACQSEIKVIQILVKNGSDFHIKDAAGMTPLALAEKYKHFKIAAYLKLKGA